MKKIIFFAVIACMLTVAVSCKSTKVTKKSSKKVKTTVVSEEFAEKIEAAVEEHVAAAEESKTIAVQEPSEKSEESEKSEKNASAKKEASEDKDFTGWIKASKKNINERFGRIQIKTKSKIGSFTLAVLNENDKPVPVLSTSNEYVTNAVYLKTLKRTYNLITDKTIRSGARKTADGIVITYEVPSVATVNLYFSFFASEKKKDYDMVKVRATVKNISDRNDEFVLKTILDTVLGETGTYHFYTYEDVPVKNEALYRTLQNQKWFVSKNMNTSMQLFFTGADCSVPELVALANYSTLEKNSWEPDMLSYRGFDTVLSYSNSAVCTIWKPMKLAPSESASVVFYMAVSGNGTPATGDKYIYGSDFENAASDKAAKDNTANGLVVITPYSVEEPSKEAEKTPVVTEAEQKQTNVTEKPADPTDVDYYLNNLSKEQLTPEYIQALIDRIEALEEDTSSINRQELLQLNVELDAILLYLRQ